MLARRLNWYRRNVGTRQHLPILEYDGETSMYFEKTWLHFLYWYNSLHAIAVSWMWYRYQLFCVTGKHQTFQNPCYANSAKRYMRCTSLNRTNFKLVTYTSISSFWDCRYSTCSFLDLGWRRFLCRMVVSYLKCEIEVHARPSYCFWNAESRPIMTSSSVKC